MSSSVESTQASALPGPELPRPEHFESCRLIVMGWVMITAGLVVAYWILWFSDRSSVASDPSAQYVAFEQAFPLADAWLLAALLATGVQLRRRRPSAIAWVFVVGGAGLYLCAMDVLYDIEHQIYTKGHGGGIELAINIITAVSSIGIIAFGWRFRDALLTMRRDRESR
jgi:hypothetical protein